MTTREEIEDLLDIVANGISATPYIGRDCDAAFNAMPKLRAAYDAIARERDALREDALREDAERWRYARENGLVRVPTVAVDHGPTIYEGAVGHAYADMAVDQLRVDAVRALDGEGAA